VYLLPSRALLLCEGAAVEWSPVHEPAVVFACAPYSQSCLIPHCLFADAPRTQAWRAAGAEVSFSVKNERMIPALREATAAWPGPPPEVTVCNLLDDASVAKALGSGGRLDMVRGRALQIANVCQPPRMSPLPLPRR
jgi:hypothetical protein